MLMVSAKPGKWAREHLWDITSVSPVASNVEEQTVRSAALQAEIAAHEGLDEEEEASDDGHGDQY